MKSLRTATSVAGFDSIIPTMLSSFGPVLIGIVVILVLSASMSTLLLTGSDLKLYCDH